MKCSNCGSNIPGSAKFCGVCGTATLPAEVESALDTVAFDPSSDPEFKAAAEKLEAENKLANEAKTKQANEAKAKQANEAKAKRANEAKAKRANEAKAKQVKEADAVKPSVKAEASAASKTASKPVQPKKNKPAKSAPETSDAESSEDETGEAADKKKGKFRETIWFMQADDPEMMSSIESEGLDEREATYQDPVGDLDERSREKFSLNISESSMMKAVDRGSLDLDESPESPKSWFYASMMMGAISLGYIVYLVFSK